MPKQLPPEGLPQYRLLTDMRRATGARGKLAGGQAGGYMRTTRSALIRGYGVRLLGLSL